MRIQSLVISLALALALAGCSAAPNESSSVSAAAGGTVQSGPSEANGSVPAPESVDGTASASVYFYQQSSLDLAQLTESIQTAAGGCTIATVNADGTPDLIVAVPAIAGEYLVFNWADNATKENVLREGSAMVAYYVYNRDGAEKADRHQGARLKVAPVADAQERAALQRQYPELIVDQSTVLQIVELLPLG